MMGQLLRPFMALLGIMALAACGGGPEQPPPPRVAVTEVVQPSTVNASDRFPAVLRADDRGRLGFELGGMVARVNVDVGDRFRRGELLATLQANQQQLGVQAASANLAQARASAREAELDFERKSALDSTGAVSRSEVDNARRVRDEAVARVNALKAQSGPGAETLHDTGLYAPYEGVVTGRLVEPSEVVGIGQSVLEVSGTGAGLEAVITVPARQRGDFRLGSVSVSRLKTVQPSRRSSNRSTPLPAATDFSRLSWVFLMPDEAILRRATGAKWSCDPKVWTRSGSRSRLSGWARTGVARAGRRSQIKRGGRTAGALGKSATAG